ncbi:MAG: polynucleotide kinase-phosphatase, partial [Planctomycetota bacterium]
DDKLRRHLLGRKVKIAHGLGETIEQLDADPIDPRDLTEFLDGLVSHLVFDEGRLVVAHAGIKEEMIGRGSGAVREMCLYGDTTGHLDEDGLPERLDWAADYRGKSLVVYGHTPVAAPRWLNHTVNIDTGCAFGGELTALRYPEEETISVPAEKTWAEPSRPFLGNTDRLSAQQRSETLLDLADVSGRRALNTRYLHRLSVPEENAAAALEVMSRFAVDPRWLIYLPPTMSPCATSEEPAWLERPEEALAYFRDCGQSRVICEEKHMGSRAVVVLARDEAAATARFGIEDRLGGTLYTRTGRPFFSNPDLTRDLLTRLRSALDAIDFWEKHETEWLCLDCEILPWSAKAHTLLTSQYAPVGAASEAWADHAIRAVDAADRPDLADLRERLLQTREQVRDYRAAYRPYCWDTDGIAGYQLAPFHLLATEGAVHSDRPHRWHMDFATALAKADPDLFRETRTCEVDLADEDSCREAVAWWENLTADGGEGMVVKPEDYLARGKRGLIQPAVKCRGREYLRIIYGPEYTRQENLERLKKRGLGAKRSLAMREFALGLESLHRFVEREPLRRVHECVFGVLALESEPVDPRL